MAQALGFTGGTLILLAVFAAGLSLFTGVSWLAVIERLGGWAEAACGFVSRKLEERAGPARGRGGGRCGARKWSSRDKKKLEVHEPVRIEPPALEIPKSPRAEREKQVPLFENLPDSLLPPLKLLDEPEKQHRGDEHGDARVHLAPDREEARSISASR